MTDTAVAADLGQPLDVHSHVAAQVTLHGVLVADDLTPVSYTHLDVYKRQNVPFGTFSAVYTGTEEPVPGLTADTCGQMLLGVCLLYTSTKDAPRGCFR